MSDIVKVDSRVKGLCDSLFSSSERMMIAAKWSTAAKYALPSQSLNFVAGISKMADYPASKSRGKLCNSAPILCAKFLSAILSDIILNEIFNQMSLSVIKVNGKVPLGVPTTQWLEGATSQLKFGFINKISTISEMFQSTVKSAVVFGDACLQVSPVMMPMESKEDIFSHVRYNTISVSDCAWTNDRYGLPTVVAYAFDMRASDIISLWPQVASESILSAVTKDPLATFRILQLSEPTYTKITYFEWLKVVDTDRRYQSTLYIADTGEFLERKYYNEPPIKIGRTELAPGEVYGSSITLDVLQDILRLNFASYRYMFSSDKADDPPIFISDENRNSKISLNPGARNYVRDINGFKYSGENPQIGERQNAIIQMEQNLKSAFYLDKLLLPPRADSPPMSAAESAARTLEVQQIVGSILDLFVSEIVTETIKTTFNIYLRNGIIPPPPQEFKAYVEKEKLRTGGVLNSVWDFIYPKYRNLVSRDKKVYDLQAAQQTLSDISVAAELGMTDTVDNFDADAYASLSFEARGASSDLQRSQNDIKAIRTQRAQTEQAAQQAEQGAKVADSRIKNAKANKISSMGMIGGMTNQVGNM